jgi:hypothetical protein
MSRSTIGARLWMSLLLQVPILQVPSLAASLHFLGSNLRIARTMDTTNTTMGTTNTTTKMKMSRAMCAIADAPHVATNRRVMDVDASTHLVVGSVPVLLLVDGTIRAVGMKMDRSEGPAPLLIFAIRRVLDTKTATWTIGTPIVERPLLVAGAASLLAFQAMTATSALFKTIPIIESTIYARCTLIGHGLVAIGGVVSLLYRMSVSMESIPIMETTHGILTLIGHGLVATGGVATPLLDRLMSVTSA